MNELVAPVVNVQELISKAIDKDVSVDTMERMLSMAERVQAERSRSDFIIAMSEFQSECSSIEKKSIVRNKDGKERYRYAKIDEIIKQVGPLLQKHGFSFSFDTKTEEKQITVVCIAQHKGGHSTKSEFTIPLEQTAFMNDAQKSGTASSYGRRYSFCNVFGITTADIDDDGQSLGEGVSIQELYRRFTKLMEATHEHYDSIKAIKEYLVTDKLELAAEAWGELGNEGRMSLNVAPTKGGPFSLEERKIMASDEFKEFFYARKKAD